MALIQKIRGFLLHKAYDNPFINWYLGNLRHKFFNPEYLSSAAYEKLFLTHIKEPTAYLDYLDDAEQKTRNFRYRHFYLGKALGAWRWKGVYQFREQLIPVIFDKNKRGIDFGGAYGPVAKNTVIVDQLPKDIFGRKIQYNDLGKLDFSPDFIFSSHTLEHISNLEEVLQELQKVLKTGGDLILNLPAYSCIRWQSGIHTNRKFNDHKWTFHLATTTMPDSINAPLAIDTLIGQYFNIQTSQYTGDNSIFIWAKKNKKGVNPLTFNH